MTDREVALQAQIEAEREQAARAIEEAFKAGWAACLRHRLAMTVELAFLRWVQKRGENCNATQRVTMRRQ